MVVVTMLVFVSEVWVGGIQIAVTVVKVVIVVVFWKHSLDDLVVLIGHVPSRSEWQLPSRRSDNRKIA